MCTAEVRVSSLATTFSFYFYMGSGDLNQVVSFTCLLTEEGSLWPISDLLGRTMADDLSATTDSTVVVTVILLLHSALFFLSHWRVPFK